LRANIPHFCIVLSQIRDLAGTRAGRDGEKSARTGKMSFISYGMQPKNQIKKKKKLKSSFSGRLPLRMHTEGRDAGVLSNKSPFLATPKPGLTLMASLLLL